MNTPHYYRSPWAVSVKITTAASCVLLIGMAGWGLFGTPDFIPVRDLPMVILPLCILFGGMLFVIRGYELTPDVLYVKRLLWRTPIDLAGLVAAEADPQALSKSFRTFGNGGLFSISGRFWSRKLGHYRAYAMDPANSVVLKLTDRVVVVTPHDPRHFVHNIKQLINIIQLKEKMK